MGFSRQVPRSLLRKEKIDTFLLEFSISYRKTPKENRNVALNEKVFVSLKLVMVQYPELVKNCCQIGKRHLDGKNWQKPP